MKPLKTTQRVLIWFSALDVGKKEPSWKRLAFIAFSSSACLGNIASTLASAAFVWINLATDLEGSLYALLQFCGTLGVTYALIFAFIMKTKTTAMIKQLTNIYNEYKNEESFEYLTQTNNKCEWMWDIFFKYVMGGFLLSTITSAIASVLICYIYNGHYDARILYRPYKFVLPWDQSTPIGYFNEILFNVVADELTVISFGNLILFFISICLHHRAFYKMFKHSVQKLDRIDKNRNDKILIRNLIRFHVTVKDWFFESAEIYSPMIAVQLILFTMLLACTTFELDLYFKHPDFTIFALISAYAAGASTLFVYCFFGKLATESYGGMAICLYDANWYNIPVELQKYFILMIGNTQKPIYYYGSGILVLNLETFLKLVKTIASYYMAFKTVTLE